MMAGAEYISTIKQNRQVADGPGRHCFRRAEAIA
jgi:hypothetical protein